MRDHFGVGDTSAAGRTMAEAKEAVDIGQRRGRLSMAVTLTVIAREPSRWSASAIMPEAPALAG